MDKRHQQRVALMQLLFAHTFDEGLEQYDDPAEITQENLDWLGKVKEQLVELDALITQFAPERPLSEINKVDLAILRLIVFEAQTKKTPHKVLADEAVELAKEFGTETSHKFVNGVLGKILFNESETVESNDES